MVAKSRPRKFVPCGHERQSPAEDIDEAEQMTSRLIGLMVQNRNWKNGGDLIEPLYASYPINANKARLPSWMDLQSDASRLRSWKVWRKFVAQIGPTPQKL